MTQDDNVRMNEGMTESGNQKQKPQAPNWLIDNIAEASKNASKVYFLYLGSLAYCALTIVSTSDRQIILNEKARLPIVNLDVSLNGFFILSPIILLIVFAYLQLYLQRVKGLTSDLRENYAAVEKRRLYPWMLNIAEDPEPGIIGKLQIMTVNLTLWILLPIILNLNAFWYIKKHDFFWSHVVCILSIIGSLVVFWFWRKYDPKQRGKPIRLMVIKLIVICLIFAFQGVLIFILIPWAKEGGRYLWLNPLICIGLRDQKLITEPDKDYEALYWGNFKEIHLEGADLTNCVLKRADLRGAHLLRASMSNAILQGVDLAGANLKGANLWMANLQGASIEGANLQGANFRWANLSKTNLSGANLQDAVLRFANLHGANLQEANLQGADLEGANLMEAALIRVNNLNLEQLLKAKTLYKAKLGDEILVEALMQIDKIPPYLLARPKEEKPNAEVKSK